MTLRSLPFAVLLLALAACKQPPAATPAPAAVAATPAAGEATSHVVENTVEMPRLQVKTVDGKDYDLASHRGHWVVINFWATWCGPCLREMPELSALHAKHGHIEVVGLAYEDIEPDEMRDFLQKHPVAYPIATLDVYNPPEDFATPRGLPMTVLVAPDGKVAKQFLGPVDTRLIEQTIADAGGHAT